MGQVFGGLWNTLTGSGCQSKIVILGLSNAGKTTILYKLALDSVVVTQPTIGSNVEELQHKNVKFHVWDVGGQDNLRMSWSNYFEDVDVLLFVVDSNDEENLTLAKMELQNCLLHPHLKDADVLVVANKQDVHGCLKPARIMEVLDLTNVRNHEWHIQPVVALTGQGLPQCMDWIAGRVLKKKGDGNVLAGYANRVVEAAKLAGSPNRPRGSVSAENSNADAADTAKATPGKESSNEKANTATDAGAAVINSQG